MKKILNLCLGLTLGFFGTSKVLSGKVLYYSFVAFDDFLDKIDKISKRNISIDFQFALKTLKHRYRDLLEDVDVDYTKRYSRYCNRYSKELEEKKYHKFTSKKEYEDFIEAQQKEEKENEKQYVYFSLGREVTLDRVCLFLFSEKRDFLRFDLKPLFIKTFCEDKQKIHFTGTKEYFDYIKNKNREEVKQSFIQQRLEQVTFLLKEFTEGFYSILGSGKTYAPFSFFGDANCYTNDEIWGIKPFFDYTVQEEKDYNLTSIELELNSLEESKKIMSIFFPRIVGTLIEEYKNSDGHSHFKLEKNDIQEHIDFITEHCPQGEDFKNADLITFLTDFQQNRLSKEEINEKFKIIEKDLINEDSFFKIRTSLLTLKKDLIMGNENIIAVAEEEVDEFFKKAEAFFLAR